MTSIPNVTDEYLVQQIVQGDLLAFDSLYNRHVKAVYKFVSFNVPETDVEDVTQEVFLAVINSLSTFRAEAQFTTWLHSVIHHKVTEYYRRRYRKKETIQVDLAEAEEYSNPYKTSDMDEYIDLHIALNNLPSHYRQVIFLRFAYEMRNNEIAEHMKISIDSVKMIFRRAIYKLQITWEENEENNDEEKPIQP